MASTRTRRHLMLLIALAVLLILVMAAVTYGDHSWIAVTINGKPLSGPLAELVGISTLAGGVLVMLFGAVLLGLLLFGVGLFLVGGLLCLGALLVVLFVPDTLPLVLLMLLAFALIAGRDRPA